MTRLEAYFFKEMAQKRDKKQSAPQTASRSRVKSGIARRGFQNTNPERGRKQLGRVNCRNVVVRISEHDYPFISLWDARRLQRRCIFVLWGVLCRRRLEYEEMEFVAADERRYIVLLIYDIVDNKRRSRMVKCVERYGIRVQKSAFEAFLSKKKYERLVEETSRLIDLETDSLRIYLLADHTSVRSWGCG